MNENHEKKNTLPYLSRGFSTGIDRALCETGFTSGGPVRYRSVADAMAVDVAS